MILISLRLQSKCISILTELQADINEFPGE